MNLIFCADKNFGIGKDNQMLFNIKQDLAFFKQKTLNNVVVMGYNTLMSLPGKKPLKNRINIVLTTKNIKIEDAIVVNNQTELFNILKNYNSNHIFIIGGQSIYNLMLPYCDFAFCTKVNASKPATVFAPNLDENKNWKKVSESQIYIEQNLEFKFVEYKNKSPKKF